MMAPSFTLPIFTFPSMQRGERPRHSPRLPRVEWIERRSPILHPSPLGPDGDVLALNVTRGCIHRCGFCAARACPSYPGDDVIQVYGHTPEKLADELDGRRLLPRAVFVSPATDPFPPMSEVQAETVRIVDVLARRGVETWLMTRGFIRPFALQALAARAKSVKVLVGMTTLDRQLQRILEPLAAPPRLRLKQIAQLRGAGVAVQVALDPLIPGLTDTASNLEPLLHALAEVGVQHVTAGYLFLRPGITDNLVPALQPHGWDEIVVDAFAGGPMLAGEGVAPARYLSKARRQRGYAMIVSLASRLGMRVSISALSNPDFAPPQRLPFRALSSSPRMAIRGLERPIRR
jgi:DNA repair photolyase